MRSDGRGRIYCEKPSWCALRPSSSPSRDRRLRAPLKHETRQASRRVHPDRTLWATAPGGIDEVGCIHTAQGLEFDYVGVIFAPDLRYDFDLDRWEGSPKYSYDAVVKRDEDQFVELVKNTYRVLLSRGMKGCYVYFMDKDTERFVRSRMEVG